MKFWILRLRADGFYSNHAPVMGTLSIPRGSEAPHRVFEVEEKVERLAAGVGGLVEVWVDVGRNLPTRLSGPMFHELQAIQPNVWQYSTEPDAAPWRRMEDADVFHMLYNWHDRTMGGAVRLVCSDN